MTKMLDCDAVMRQLWDYLDDELTPQTARAIRAHLAVCRRCYPQYEFEAAFLRALRAAGLLHAGPEVLRARVRSLLRADGFAA